MSTIFPGSASVGQIFDGYIFNGTAWDIIGIDLTAEYLETSAASATYLTKISASNTYLNQTSASITYATKTELNNIDALPSQTGNTGKYLTTNGSVASWGTLELSTYLTQSSASTTYATKAELANIDLSSASAAAVAAIVDSAPATLDTLNELAAALGDDANYASTITTALGTKAPLASPTFTGSVTIGEAITKTTSTTLTSASTTTIATFPGSPGLSAECMVVFSSESSGAQTTSKVLIVGSYDEGTVDITEYAIIERGGILEEPIQTTLSASFSGSNIVLRAAAVNYQAVNVKVISTHILSPLGAA